MKKNYSIAFLGTLLMFFVALSANAQVKEVTDLFGTYSLSCKVGDNPLEPMDFQIVKSDNAYFKKGMIVGFLGSETPLYISKFDAEAHTIQVNNATYSAGGFTMYYSNEDGSDNMSTGYNLIFTFDPETKALSLPDFGLGTFSGANFSVSVVYTDVTATYKDELKVEDADWSGKWSVEKSQNDYNYGGKNSYPESFTFTIVKDNGKFYITEFLGQNIEALTNGGIELQASGDKAIIKDGSLAGKANDGTMLYVSGPYGGDIEFEMVAGAIKNNSWGFMIQEGASKTNAYYYGCSNYLKASDAIDRAGSYAATATIQMDFSEGTAPTTGMIEVMNKNNEFIVTKFLDFTPFTMDYKQMVLTPDASNASKASINCAMLKFVEATADGNYVYWGLADQNLSTSDVPVSFDADGNLVIGEFCIAKYTFNSSFAPVGTPELVAWYSGLKATLGGTIDAISSVNGDAQEEYFNLSGTKVSSMQKGINIVRKGGKTYKVLVK